MSAIVTARGLSVLHRVGRSHRPALVDVDLDIEEGEAFGLVGPSGSGKSTLAHVLTRYLPRAAVLRADALEVAGRDLLRIDGAALRTYRRTDIGVVYQEPARALNPTVTVGAQVAEVHALRGDTRRPAQRAAVDSLAAVGLADPAELARRYPHELSGGQQQRAMIAMALATRPRLLILDEPTTGLDALVQADIMALVAGLQAEQRFATLLISHDLALVAGHCARVGVLDAGRLVRTTDAATLVPEFPPARTRPRRTPEDLGAGHPGHPTTPVLAATGLRKRYGTRLALDGVDVSLDRGETLGIVGETGSGKTTLGRAVAGLVSAEGSVVVDAPSTPRPVQMVLQSPEASLNPRKTVRQTLRRAIALLGGDWTPESLAERMGLDGDVLDRHPAQLSGGQKQRVAIARAFAGVAPIVVCDEPTSALDSGVQERILDLLVELQERTGVAYLFISHDLAVIRRVAHRVAVMREGRILETVPADALQREATHPYTRALIAGRMSDT